MQTVPVGPGSSRLPWWGWACRSWGLSWFLGRGGAPRVGVEPVEEGQGLCNWEREESPQSEKMGGRWEQATARAHPPAGRCSVGV